MNKPIESQTAFDNFFETIKTLRSPNGCPWDIKQTPQTMRESLVEECFEAIEAINNDNAEHVKEELGDIFLNTAMISYMYEQEKIFSVDDVLKNVTDKLIRRHPHVFPESEGQSESINAKTADQVLDQWENIKKNIEGRSKTNTLDEVPKGIPPLLRAAKLQKKAAKLGFDWNDTKPVFSKIREELEEVEEALEQHQSTSKANTNMHLEEEIGDLLFAVVNAARHLGIAPEVALSRTNEKFYHRFNYVESKMNENDIPMNFDHLKDMDFFWEESKKRVDKYPQK